MASYRAIETVCKAVLALLEANYRRALFSIEDVVLPDEMTFTVYSSANLETGMPSGSAGITLYLHQIAPNGSHRTPAGRIGPRGERYATKLPVDLRFILTAWADHTSLQQSLLGWMMRTLEDTPIIPFGLLEQVASGVFFPDESVELSLDDLPLTDMLQIWETLPNARYQLSVPYRARNVRIESIMASASGEPVQERQFKYEKVVNGAPA